MKHPPPHDIVTQISPLHVGIAESVQSADAKHVVTTSVVVTMVFPVKKGSWRTSRQVDQLEPWTRTSWVPSLCTLRTSDLQSPNDTRWHITRGLPLQHQRERAPCVFGSPRSRAVPAFRIFREKPQTIDRMAVLRQLQVSSGLHFFSRSTLSLGGKFLDDGTCGSNKSHHLKTMGSQGENRNQLLQLEPALCTPRQVQMQHTLLVLTREFPAGGRRHAPDLYAFPYKR